MPLIISLQDFNKNEIGRVATVELSRDCIFVYVCLCVCAYVPVCDARACIHARVHVYACPCVLQSVVIRLMHLLQDRFEVLWQHVVDSDGGNFSGTRMGVDSVHQPVQRLTGCCE